MTRGTAAKLNALNKDFYDKISQDFSRTRQSAWAGWQKLKPYIDNLPTPFAVLDVGCGNGRFFKFLEQEGYGFGYEGVDNNQSLLKEVPKARVHRADFLEQDLTKIADKPCYDLVVMFGVVHHLPGLENRKKLLEDAANLVSPGGYLVISLWQFALDPRFLNKVIAWEKDADVEPNDYLLSWNNQTNLPRYCHFVDRDEEQELLRVTNLKLVESFEADGKSGKLNRYLICQRVA